MMNKMVARVLTYKLGSQIMAIQREENLHKEDCLAIFKPGVWQTGFCEEWYHFQQELMLSKRIVKLFS